MFVCLFVKMSILQVWSLRCVEGPWIREAEPSQESSQEEERDGQRLGEEERDGQRLGVYYVNE